MLEISNDNIWYWKPDIFANTNFLPICLTRPEGFTRAQAEEKLTNYFRVHAGTTCSPARLQVNFGLNIQAGHKIESLAQTDAVLTQKELMPFYFQPGDCLPIFLWDEFNQVGGVMHASWRQIPDLPMLTIHKMFRTFNSRPANLLAAIGPSIGPCCYKFKKEVTAQVDQPFWQNFIREKDDLIEINLQAAAIASLKSNGVKKIELADICTCCTKKNDEFIFPSYFREKAKTLFIAAFCIT